MNAIKKIYTIAMILLAAELGVMIISILAKPLSDAYLKIWGIIVLVTMAVAICCFILKLREKRKEG